MRDFRERLDQLIDGFLTGKLKFSTFQHAYFSCYIDERADAGFRVDEVDHYGAVHEKAEWTTTQPTAEERGYGWVDEREFREWLRVHEQHKPPVTT